MTWTGGEEEDRWRKTGWGPTISLKNYSVFQKLHSTDTYFTCLTSLSVSQLQLIQNSATGLLTQFQRFYHIILILAALHWIPVTSKLCFKIVLLTYKGIHGLVPEYNNKLLTPHYAARPLISAYQNPSAVSPTRLKTKGDHALSTLAPWIWNTPLLKVRSDDSSAVLNIYRMAYSLLFLLLYYDIFILHSFLWFNYFNILSVLRDNYFIHY